MPEQTYREEGYRHIDENDSAPYLHVCERCEDRHRFCLSRAIIIFVSGSGILALLLLSEIGVLHFPFSPRENSFFFFLYAGAGVLFEVSAAVYLYRAIRFRHMMADEAAMTSRLTEWFLSTYDSRQIDSCVFASCDQIDSEETLEQRRLYCIHCFLTRENGHLSDAYADSLSRELYTLIYGSK